MKQLKYISIISIMALITAPAVADIASAEYVDASLGTKLSNNATGDEAIAIGVNGGASGDYAVGINGWANSENSIAIGGGYTSEDGYRQISIGDESIADGSESVSVGASTYSVNGSVSVGPWADSAARSVSIGMNAISESGSISIGYNASSHDNGSIQLGTGENQNPGTFQVKNWTLLDANGKIPADRLTFPTTGPRDGKYNIIWDGSQEKFVLERFEINENYEIWDALDDGVQADVMWRGEDGDPKGCYLHWDTDRMCAINDDWSEGYDCTKGEFAYMTDGEWKLSMSSINLNARGWGLCSTTPKPSGAGSYPMGDPDDSTQGQYCWCMMGDPDSTNFVYLKAGSNDCDCLQDCPRECANALINNSSFRSALINARE